MLSVRVDYKSTYICNYSNSRSYSGFILKMVWSDNIPDGVACPGEHIALTSILLLLTYILATWVEGILVHYMYRVPHFTMKITSMQSTITAFLKELYTHLNLIISVLIIFNFTPPMFVTTIIRLSLSYLNFPSEWRFQMNNGHTLIKNKNGHGSLFTFVILISHYYTYHYNSKWEQILSIPFTEEHESSSQDNDYTAVRHTHYFTGQL